MSASDQLPMDLGIDITHTDQAWRDFSDPDRRARAAAAFRARIGLEALPELPWPENDMELAHIAETIDAVFSSMRAVLAPENRTVADELVCFLIECNQRWCGAELYNWPDPEPENLLFGHDVAPALHWPGAPKAEDSSVVGLIGTMTYTGWDDPGFAWLVGWIREEAGYYLRWCLVEDVDSPLRTAVYARPDDDPAASALRAIAFPD